MAASHDAPALPPRFFRALLVSTGVLLSALLGSSQAQVQSAITSDGTLGTTVTQSGAVSTIKDGTRRGSNLFHSFERFSVGTGETASFTSEQTGITHILSRVTGGHRSDIDGLLRTDGQLRAAGAHLYLLNPSGILFGPNARLDVTGSFHVSTADYLRLADEARFSARLSETSTLSVAPPVAFGFLGPQPAAITVQGSTLQVPEGATLSVVGGETQIGGGTLVAPSGRIQLASVAGAGEVWPVLSEPAPELQVDSGARLGRIELSQRARVDASGNGGGAVLIRGGRLLVDNAFMAAENQGNLDGPGLGLDLRITADAFIINSVLSTDSLGGGRARDLRLTAGSVHLEQGTRMRSNTSGAGHAGSIVVEAPRVALTGGAQIVTETVGAGQGGTIRVTATDTLTLAGLSPNGIPRSGLSATAFGTGAAGSIVVEAPRVALTGGAQIVSQTYGAGQGGTIRVTATDTLTLAGTSQNGFVSSELSASSLGTATGAAGSIIVEAPRVALTGGAKIVSNTVDAGQGGTIRVTATDTLTLAGLSPNGFVSSSLSATASGTGAAGSIVVEAPRVALTGGAQIISGTRGAGQGGTIRVTATDTLTLAGTPPTSGPSGLSAIAFETATGAAGSIVVEAPRVVLTGGAQMRSNTSGAGQGGPIRVTATDTLTLDGLGSSLSATASGTGAAGSVVVEASRVALTGGAQINSSTFGPGQGGTVTVTTANALTITGHDSGLRTTAASSGRGGDIAVDAHQVQLTEGAVISAESIGMGNAGSITITVRDTFLSQHGTVTTNASEAKGGNIRVTAPAMVRLQESQITATVGSGAGDGGNVTIDSAFILLQGSQLTANAVAGNGGRIALTASQALLRDPGSVITASSTLGLQGEVNIQTPVTSLSGAVAPLPQAFTQTTELLQSRCVERLREGMVSRLVLGGRDGVPLEPGSLLLSPLQRVDQESGVQTGQRQPQHPEPQHTWVSSALAHARERGEGECARWMGQSGTPGAPNRRR